MLAAAAARADHESQPVIVAMRERLDDDGHSAQAARDALRRGLRGTARKNLEDAIRKGVAMLLEPIQRAQMGLHVLGQRLDQQALILAFMACARHAKQPKVCREPGRSGTCWARTQR